MQTIDERILEVLNEYRVRCIHGKKIGINQDQAFTQLSQLYREKYLEMLPKKKKRTESFHSFEEQEEAERNVRIIQGFNQALAEMRERIKEI